MRGWIGVDLDGTLAHYEGWEGLLSIGPPIPVMVSRVKQWRKEGIEVRIFTARACVEGEDKKAVLQAINAWSEIHLGEILEVTNVKDFYMVELWDDRCVQVEANTGAASVQTERELCAKLAESAQAVQPDPHWDAAKLEIAEAIRARK